MARRDFWPGIFLGRSFWPGIFSREFFSERDFCRESGSFLGEILAGRAGVFSGKFWPGGRGFCGAALRQPAAAFWRAGRTRRRNVLFLSGFFLQIVDFLNKVFSPSAAIIKTVRRRWSGRKTTRRPFGSPRRDACAGDPGPGCCGPTGCEPFKKNTASPPPPGRPRRGAADKLPSVPARPAGRCPPRDGSDRCTASSAAAMESKKLQKNYKC